MLSVKRPPHEERKDERNRASKKGEWSFGRLVGDRGHECKWCRIIPQHSVRGVEKFDTATGTPASACFKTWIICSTLNRFFFVRPSAIAGSVLSEG
jgi:hypothetical protein